MDISLLENKYTNLKRAYHDNEIDAETFQTAVDELRIQDDYGRFWTLGVESGKWYYFDGREWMPADPAEADALPFIDEDGVYWMLGRESKEWYYFDGEKWVRPDEVEAQPAAAALPIETETEANQYYQDDDGRYWSLGKKSGEWYYYDETGWHRADNLQQQQPQPAYQPYSAPTTQQPVSPPQPHTVPFQPIQTAPNYFQSPPTGQEYTQPVQPQQPYGPGPSPSQPVYPQNYTQPLGPQPQPQYDPQAYTQPNAPYTQPPPQPEPGAWMYYDGQQWVRYQEDPNARPGGGAAGAYQEDYFEEDYIEAEDMGHEEVIQVDDLEDFVEVVEVDETDIIEAEEDEELVEAEFHVEVLTQEEEATAIAAVATAAQAEAHTVPLKVEPATPAAQPKTGATPKVTSPPQTERPELSPRGIPAWLSTSLVGVFALVFVAALLIGALHTFTNSRETDATAVAQIETPTLAAGAPVTTPTVAQTPSPTATEPPPPTEISLAAYDSPDFGFSIEYPAGWVSDEQDELVVFAPSSRSLDTTSLNGAALWVARRSNQDLTRLLADGLGQFEPISQTLNEGTMLIGSESWASAQVEFTSEDMGGQAIALVASTVRDEMGYTLIAIAPAAEWEDYIQLFQKAVDSFEFRSQAVAAAEAETPPADGEGSSGSTSDRATATPTATATPEAESAEPIVHIVAAGDTLGAIAVQYDVAVEDIVAANNLAGANAILSIDEELIIPQDGVPIAALATATPVSDESPAATPTEAADEAEEAVAAAPTATTAPTTAPTPTPQSAPSLAGRIAYPAYSTDINGFNVWVANIDGSNPQIVGGNASQPKFSRDGSLLAYRSWIPSQRGIFFLDFTGGRQGLLTNFIEDGLPTWSPDDTIVFSSRREGDRIPRLFRVTQRGDDSYSLGFISEYADTMPDGRLVARGCTPSGDCGLWVTLPDGSGEVKISTDTSDTAVASSPQGDKIAIMSSNRAGANNWEIWTIDPNGSNAKRLTNNAASDGLPTWSPDGRSIAFVSNREGVWAIWVMNSDGSNQRKLFNMQGPPDGQVLHDVPNSRGWLEERISWAP